VLRINRKSTRNGQNPDQNAEAPPKLSKKQRKATTREAKIEQGEGEGNKTPPTGVGNNNSLDGKQNNDHGNAQIADGTPKLSRQRKAAAREAKHSPGGGEGNKTPTYASNNNSHDGKQKTDNGNDQHPDATPKLSMKQRKAAAREAKPVPDGSEGNKSAPAGASGNNSYDGKQHGENGLQSAADKSKPTDGQGKSGGTARC
jgi:hypothetical protein